MTLSITSNYCTFTTELGVGMGRILILCSLLLFKYRGSVQDQYVSISSDFYPGGVTWTIIV